jgi:uncharacterized protein (TIGR03083 family)
LSHGPGAGQEPAQAADGLAADLRDSVSRAAGKASALVRDLDSTQALTADGVWTVRETAVHLVACGHLYASLLAGQASPLEDRSQSKALNGGAFLALAETRPAALADLIGAGARAFLDVLAGVAPGQLRPWHYGRQVPCAIHAALLADEYLMHGTDIALAARTRWDGDQGAAATVCRVLIPWLTPLRWIPGDASLAGAALAIQPAGQQAVAFKAGPETVTVMDDHDGSPDCLVTGPPMQLLQWYFQREPWESAGLSAGGPRADIAPGLSDRLRPI